VPTDKKHYGHALSIDPRQPEAQYNLGYVMLERGKAKEAVMAGIKTPTPKPLADKPAETDTRVQQARGKWAGILDDGAMRLSSLLTRVTSG